MSTAAQRKANRKYMRKFRKTPEGRAYERARFKTPKMRAYLRAYHRAYYNTPKWRAYRRAYYRAYDKTPKMRAYYRSKNHERNARICGNGGTWKPEDFAALCAKYRNRCLCCGKRRKMTPDHVKPICRGGRNVLSNLQPLCGPCNSSKNARTIDYRRNPHPACRC